MPAAAIVWRLNTVESVVRIVIGAVAAENADQVL
jgi:hypothetical protein